MPPTPSKPAVPWLALSLATPRHATDGGHPGQGPEAKRVTARLVAEHCPHGLERPLVRGLGEHVSAHELSADQIAHGHQLQHGVLDQHGRALEVPGAARRALLRDQVVHRRAVAQHGVRAHSRPLDAAQRHSQELGVLDRSRGLCRFCVRRAVAHDLELPRRPVDGAVAPEDGVAAVRPGLRSPRAIRRRVEATRLDEERRHLRQAEGHPERAPVGDRTVGVREEVPHGVEHGVEVLLLRVLRVLA